MIAISMKESMTFGKFIKIELIMVTFPSRVMIQLGLDGTYQQAGIYGDKGQDFNA
jgi:hypothetical protein